MRPECPYPYPEMADQEFALHVRLALHVVWTALADLGRPQLEDDERADALDFLLHRINEPDNIWGVVIFGSGATPLTRQRIQMLARKIRLPKAPPAFRRGRKEDTDAAARPSRPTP